MIRAFLKKVFLSILALAVGRSPLDLKGALGDASSILLFKPDGIGDFVLWAEVFKEFARRYESSRITLLCCLPTGDLARSMFPAWNVVEIPRRPKNIPALLWMLLRNPELIKIEKHEVLVDIRPHRVLWELFYVAILDASRKIGFDKSSATSHGPSLPERKFFDLCVPQPNPDFADHEIFECAELRLVNQFSSYMWGLRLDGAEPDLRMFSWTQPEVQMGKRHWVIGPFSGNVIRDYPLPCWREVFQKLLSQAPPPDSLLICGALSQRGMGEQLADMLKDIIPIKNLCGRLLLSETAGILLQSELVFATESAMAHLSVALRRPTIAILGGGHYGLFAPWGTKAAPVHWIWNRLDCYGCNWKCIHPTAICIQNIPPIQIVKKSLDLLSVIRSEKNTISRKAHDMAD